MKISLNLRRTLPSLRYTSEFDLQCRIDKAKLSEIADPLLRRFLPFTLNQGHPIKDLKGRDARNLIDHSIPAHLHPTADELCLVEGTVYEQAAENASHPYTGTSFTLAVTTPFHEFIGNHHIAHRIEMKRHGALPSVVEAADVARAIPIELTRFRLGLDIFHSSYFAVFGFAPVVKETLLIECTQDECRLRIVAENLPSRATLPLARDQLLERLSIALEPTLGISVVREYQQRSGDEHRPKPLHRPADLN